MKERHLMHCGRCGLAELHGYEVEDALVEANSLSEDSRRSFLLQRRQEAKAEWKRDHDYNCLAQRRD